MDDDQQFCLRWNNHQSTLISVFDTLLENETLVDCTLAAEGKFLKAHKVVLSACSPYFATLLQEQYDKHPIFILKDVKYQELRAMMDYMYRGEVNISQDQLAALLKAAESLQIKGLSDNRTGGGSSAPKPEQQQHHRGKLGGAYTLEQTKRARLGTASGMDVSGDVSGSREGSSSPSRRRRKVRRRSMENDVHDNSNSSVLQAASNQSLLQQTGAGLAVSALVSTQLASGPSAGSSSQTSSTQQQQPLTSTNVTKKTESAKLTSSTAAAAPATGSATASAGTAGQQQQGQGQAQNPSDAINTDNVQAQSQGGAQGVQGDDEDMDSSSGAVSGGSVPATGGAAAIHTGVVVKQLASVVDKSSNHKQKIKDNSVSSVGSEMVIEPKAEYDDDAHDENVEDLTLDEEDMTMEELDQTAGTSQGGEGSSQTYATWQHDRSQDELGLMAQDAQQRDPQDLRTLYCNYATAVIAAASAASKKPPVDQQQQHNHHHSATTTNNSQLPDISEPEVTIRRMYKCGSAGQAEAIGNHLQPAAKQLHCTAASNCGGCQMSAAAASFQLASLLNNSIRSTASSKPQPAAASGNNSSQQSGNSNSTPKKPSVQFHCEFCNFSCSWRYDLKLHLRQKHGIHQLKKL
ncbi:uncharacterized protein Dana_GF11096, isoform F [Drosophila ananassae]|uniref:Uncharacterized protein, isoform F n=1 Tax=Drosophila ananassae TaxID=7217 RepID=A0A0P8XRP6_DROAN|nr:longitudinals lacking protein, isoforms H/M/V isoform X11 [Drosophila ananassae]KPU77243.1 uncharacterized protein Dana_GF11096, isoform F [Drosophila ananassae]